MMKPALLASMLAIWLCLYSPDISHNKEFIAITVNNAEVYAEIADTDKSRQIGLSSRRSLPPKRGMLFIYETPGKYGFWMWKTLIPLDIIWLNKDRRVVDIKKRAEPVSYPEVFKPKLPASYTLEVNAGFADLHQLKIGEQLIFDYKD